MNINKEQIVFSNHALDQMAIRGASKDEVEKTVSTGEKSLAKKERISFIKNFPFDSKWKNQYYSTKQLKVIAKKESGKYIIITVFTFYFGGK